MVDAQEPAMHLHPFMHTTSYLDDVVTVVLLWRSVEGMSAKEHKIIEKR
jgi:hypothetical protein